jgi:hypothetical protein
LALFVRLLSARADRVVMQASENLHNLGCQWLASRAFPARRLTPRFLTRSLRLLGGSLCAKRRLVQRSKMLGQNRGISVATTMRQDSQNANRLYIRGITSAILQAFSRSTRGSA